jgi:hypothetical protein
MQTTGRPARARPVNSQTDRAALERLDEAREWMLAELDPIDAR